MSRETIVTDEEGNTYSFDNLSTQKWLDGHWSGLDQCVQWLDQQAMVLFGERKRERAVYLQTLADEMEEDLRPRMIQRAKEHAEEFPYQIDTVVARKRGA